jgi:hypothetical protein
MAVDRGLRCWIQPVFGEVPSVVLVRIAASLFWRSGRMSDAKLVVQTYLHFPNWLVGIDAVGFRLRLLVFAGVPLLVGVERLVQSLRRWIVNVYRCAEELGMATKNVGVKPRLR